jgi:hypothetical protein
VRPLSRYELRAVRGAGAQAGGSPAEQIDHRAVLTGPASRTDPVSGFALGGRHSGHPGTNVPFSSDRGMGAFAEPRLATTDWATSPAVARPVSCRSSQHRLGALGLLSRNPHRSAP